MPISSELKQQILNYIKQPIPQNDKMPIVERSIPVPFFGNIETARVATISINPSNLEFEDAHGKVLKQDKKRFVDRDELGVQDTSFLDDEQANLVYGSLMNYFNDNHNPYMEWFSPLEKHAGKLFNYSYCNGGMVHLDIYPWATKQKWDDKNHKEQNKVNALNGYKLLKKILSEKKFDYIYINGKTVKEQLERYKDDLSIEITASIINVLAGKRGLIHKHKYDGKLGTKTKLRGSSCYIQNPYGIDLYDLHKKI